MHTGQEGVRLEGARRAYMGQGLVGCESCTCTTVGGSCVGMNTVGFRDSRLV